MKKLTLALAAAGLLSIGTVAHAGNFDGFSLGIEGQLKSTSTSMKLDDFFSMENLGGKHNFIPAISGSYTFAVAPKFLLGIGATYDLGSTDVGDMSVHVDEGYFFSTTVKEKNKYSISVTPGYLVNDTTLLYGKISYNKMKSVLSWVDEYWEESGSASQKFSGVGFGAGIKVALTKNIHAYTEAQRVNYSAKTDGFITLKPSSTIGSVGVAYKF